MRYELHCLETHKMEANIIIASYYIAYAHGIQLNHCRYEYAPWNMISNKSIAVVLEYLGKGAMKYLVRIKSQHRILMGQAASDTGPALQDRPPSTCLAANLPLHCM